MGAGRGQALQSLVVRDHVALQHGVIEDQIDVEGVAIQRQSLLSGHEGKSLSQFSWSSPPSSSRKPSSIVTVF